MGKIKKIFENYATMKVAKKHGRTREQQEFRKHLSKILNETRAERDSGRDSAIILFEKERRTEKYISSLGKDRFLGKEFAMDLIEQGKGELVVKYLDKFKGLDHGELAQILIDRGEGQLVTDYLDNFDWAERQLQPYLCHAYDIYLKTQKGGEHCPLVEIGGYVFAALGFTCGHVDAVQVFSKKGKPLKTTKNAVNTIIRAGGIMEEI